MNDSRLYLTTETLLNICGYEIIESGVLYVPDMIAYTYFDFDDDDFEKAAILPGYYEYVVYKIPAGYKIIQIIIDGIENDLPNYCYIEGGELKAPEKYKITDSENNIYYDIPA